jgi:hypothetical protein
MKHHPMNLALVLSAGLAGLVALAGAGGSDALAAPAKNLCVPEATGVPTMEGPPQWLPWSTRPQSVVLDDPRWRGAAGHSFEHGSAKAPMHSRFLWKKDPGDGKDYLYLSFLVDVEALTDTTTTSPRDVFVGFRRSMALGTEQAYIFQFHLNGTAAAGPVTATTCNGSGDCGGANYWRLYTDLGNYEECDGIGGAQYLHTNNDAAKAPWMADSLRYWKLGSSESAFLKNRWAVQLRIPMVAPGLPLTDGVDRDSLFWYEAKVQQGSAGAGSFLDLAWWPRPLTTVVCPISVGQGSLIHRELGALRLDDPADPFDISCPTCSVDKFGKLTLYAGGTPPMGCDRGVSISPQDIGTIFEATAATNLLTEPLATRFKAQKADTTIGTNTVVARVTNHGAAVNAPILARFRLAGWGSAPWSVMGEHGQWQDMRAAKNGVCGTGTAPTCSDTAIASGGKVALSFPWTIGDDTGPGGIGASEYCKYDLTPPATVGSCDPAPCSCTAADAKCDVASGSGVRAPRAGGGHWPCVSSYYKADQCMLVELSAPNGGVDFEVQSSWHNMSFGEMSTMEREALIDARGLPKAQGQTEQDIYLVAMPRNMPQAFPGGTTTGNQLVGERSFQEARRITDSYRESYDRTPEEDRRRIAARYKRPPPSPERLERGRKHFGEELLIAEQIRSIVDPEDYRRVDHLLDLAIRAVDSQVSAAQITEEVYHRVGPAAAADIVPTLEIYAYYRPLDKGRLYLPMTSFAVFLSHQGAMNGIDWEIDGATRVGLNVYRLRIPVDHARKIRVRSQAIEPGELVQKPGDPRWPCGGCCGSGARCGVLAGLNNMTPTLLGGVFVFGKRRRRRKGAQSTAGNDRLRQGRPSHPPS